MAHYDCLLVGHNELDFQEYYNILENMASSGGRDHVAFTDLQFNCVEFEGKRRQAQDMLSVLHGKDRAPEDRVDFYNGDCLWTAISYLGSYLDDRDYSFDYINLFQDEREALARKLRDNEYTVVALTGTMYVFEQNIWEVVHFIRDVCPTARIVAGGPYISKQAEEREAEYLRPLFKYLNADYYCYSREGEQTLLRLIDALKAGTDLSVIPNLAYRDGRRFTVTEHVRENNVFDANRINYSLFSEGYGRSGWANVRLSDGCPYACGFCSFPEHGNERYVVMRLKRIEEELDAIKASGAITHIFFVDATLNVPKPQFKAMMRLMIEKNYGFKWHCFFRCDQADEEMVQLMAEAGCIGVFLGLESANETVLANMDKSAHKADFRAIMPLLERAGIRSMVSVQVGFPGETRETFQDTMDFLEEIKPDFTRIQIWFCDVTTPVWRKRDQFGLEGKGYGWKHDTMDAKTAVTLVERAFMSLRGVTWVPDPGFNWVNFYMLEKKGMPIDRQQAFLRVFSAAAKERLVWPGRSRPSAGLVAEMEALARFEDEPVPEIKAAEAWDGARYLADEAYWVERFQALAESGVTDPARVDPLMDAAVAPVALPGAARDALAEALGLDGVDVVRLAAAQAPRDWRGVGGAVLHSPDDEMPYPLPLSPLPEDGDARAALAAQGAEDTRARGHRLFGLYLMSSPPRLAHFDLSVPVAREVVLVADPGEDPLAVVERRFREVPEAFAQLDLALVVYRDGTLGAAHASRMVEAEDVAAVLARVGDLLVRAAAELPGGTDGAVAQSLEVE